MKKPRDPVIRFWRKVIKNGPIKNLNLGNCWIWNGHVANNGYGVFNLNGRPAWAHRMSYIYSIGLIPEGLVLDHLCKNTCCIRPAHLEAVTQRENLMRSPTFQAINSRKTHCPHGHQYSSENTYLKPIRGRYVGRICIACRNYERRSRRMWARINGKKAS
jgi:hypothetical protein